MNFVFTPIVVGWRGALCGREQLKLTEKNKKLKLGSSQL
jgi:hypothetical protein